MEERFEEEYVRAFYRAKSAEFSRTRETKWPFVNRFFEENVKSGMLVLDGGCGNGRFATECTVGVDFSAEMLACARPRSAFALVHATCMSLPFESGSFDVVLSVAVIHHFCTAGRRESVLGEIVRVMKIGAKVLICAWGVEAARRGKFYKKQVPAVLEEGDFLVGWRGSRCVDRYYHLFTSAELRGLVEGAGLVILSVGTESNNHYVVAQKAGWHA